MPTLALEKGFCSPSLSLFLSLSFYHPPLPSQANIKEVDVSIPAKLHNSLIGAKGRLVRSIMEECGGVHIHFPSEGSGSDKVTIRGPGEEVEKAKRQLLQIAEEKVPNKSEVARCYQWGENSCSLAVRLLQ